MDVPVYKKKTVLLNIDHIARERLAAIDSEGGQLTYGQISDLALDLRERFERRSFCFMLVENTVECALWIMGALASERLVPLILDFRLDANLMHSLLETYRPSYVYTPGGGLRRTEYEASCSLHADLSHLLPTSGSTGSPKLVRHKYENIDAAALNISTFFELTEKDRPLLVLPLYYTMGLSVLFSHLRVGATVLLTKLNMMDAGFWKYLSESRATSFTGVPYSYYILNQMRFFRMDLPDLELLTQGGGKMPTDLNQKFADFCRQTGKRWIATYGQSECTARMAWLPPKWACEKVGSIGIAVPNAELSLVDEKGNRIEENGVEGEMCYRGKNVTMGYANQRDDLALGDEWHGFIHTGDLAVRDEDGCYYIVGRLSRFLKLYGKRLGLDECEQMVQTELGVECACVGTDEKLIVYVTIAQLQQQVKQVLVRKTNLVATSFEVRVIDSIPKNETGKIQYQQLKNT